MPKREWWDVMDSDMKLADVSKEDAGARVEWKLRKVADPKYMEKKKK